MKFLKMISLMILSTLVDDEYHENYDEAAKFDDSGQQLWCLLTWYRRGTPSGKHLSR